MIQPLPPAAESLQRMADLTGELRRTFLELQDPIKKVLEINTRIAQIIVDMERQEVL